MEIPLTPLEFVRRTRALYGDREAVVDYGEGPLFPADERRGDAGAGHGTDGRLDKPRILRLTYSELFDRTDRWSAALQRLGVRAGDRVAYIAPNTHAQLESFYAVPQMGAVLVPINYRLTADDFLYLINHSGAKVVCAHHDYLDAVESIRSQLAGVRHFVALEGLRPGWLDYEHVL